MGIEFNKAEDRMWVAYGMDGIRLFNSSNLPDFTYIKTYNTADFPFINNLPISTLELYPLNDNIIFITVKSLGFMIIDFTNHVSPILKKTYNITGDHDDIEFFGNGTLMALASGYF